jgi:hypothetical protein
VGDGDRATDFAGLIAFGVFPAGQSVRGKSVVSLPAAPGEWRNVLTGENLGTSRAARGTARYWGGVSQLPRSLANRQEQPSDRVIESLK